jgi:uncharacterized protein
MSKRPVDPRRLDVEAFADAAGELAGVWPLANMHRLAEMACAEPDPAGLKNIEWAIRGERRKAKPGQPQVWLHLSAMADLSLVCQRCLQPSLTHVHVARSFIFVPGEDAAAALDEDSEDDVLALSPALDVVGLLEDELLLALPLVPRHEQCPEPLLVPDSDAVGDIETPHPFAVLAGLKGGGRPS